MNERIIKRISCYLHAFQFSAAMSQAAFSFFSGLWTVESALCPTKRDIGQIRHSRILFQIKSGFVRCVNDSRTADSVESIDNQDSLSFTFCLISRKDFRRKTFSSPVYGCHFEWIDKSRFYFDTVIGFADQSSVVESSVSDACIYHIFPWTGCRFQWIVFPFPSKFQCIFLFSEMDSEVADRKRLHYIVFAMLTVYKLQDTFVDSTSYGKLEIRIMTELHICKVLMREQFDNRGRSSRKSCLTVIPVPHAAACPW